MTYPMTDTLLERNIDTTGAERSFYRMKGDKMMILSGLFAISSCLLTIGASSDISNVSNYGQNLSSLYSYIGSELEDRPTMIEVEVEEFEPNDIKVLTSSEGLKTYENSENKDYDYEMYNIKAINHTKSTKKKSDGKITYLVRLFPSYRETKEQTQFVHSKVAEIIAADNQVQSLSDEDKYEWIYDYIISHVDYDFSYTNLTAYSALKDGTTICGGYSSLYYAFAKELGLSCRIAYGETTGGYHAWNLTYLNGEWYYTDSTMGDNIGYRNQYILKSKNSISTHSLESGYTSVFSFAANDYSFN
jgi:transglutaminase/protease-like cytokinesis protein 3